MVNKAINLLQAAKHKGVFISLGNGELELKFSKGIQIDPLLLQEIKDNKQLLIDFLSADQWKSANVDSFEKELKPFDRNEVTHIPLSFSQERLWFIHQLEGSVQYHLPAILRLKGKLDIAALQAALKHIVNRHEVLRTVLQEKDGEVYQSMIAAAGWELSINNGELYKSNPKLLNEFIKGLIVIPFDLSHDYMLRASLITLQPEEHVLVVNMHHIASDGWSLSIIVKEVAALYNGYGAARPVELEPLPIQYADFAFWQRKYFVGEVLNKKINYWKNKLQGVAPLQLPTDYSRPAIQSNRGATNNFSIEKELATKLHSLGQDHGATMFMILLAALKVLLFRYSGQPDICVGTPIAGRQHEVLEELVGFFVNTLALRNELNGTDSFRELLQQVKTTTTDAYAHQEAPFEKVVEAVVKQRDMSRSPLFQVLFVLQNAAQSTELELKDLTLSGEKLPNNSAKFDLSFYLSEAPDGLHGSIEYCTDLYTAATIQRMISHFRELLSSIVAMPSQQIGLLPMLGHEEEDQLLKAFNNTAVEYPANQTLLDLFEEQAAKTPAAVALIVDEEQLSYQALNESANQLAHYLVSKGVAKDSLVPVFIERGTAMLTAILAILKAGAAYVPIDPEYPAERISYMLEDTRAAVIVTSRLSSVKLPKQEGVELIEVDGDAEQIGKQLNKNLRLPITGEQLAYMIYTSGSTGKPKGVLITHGNVYSFLNWCKEEFANDLFEIVYATTSMCFDLSIFEFFYPLITGRRLRVLENGLFIGKYLGTDRQVLTNTVPSIVENLIREGTDLSNITVMNMAGEPIPLYVQQNVNTKRIAVRNLYGPTEDTTYSTVYRLQPGKPVLIGKPISNTTIHIVNAQFALVPIGVAGEICISGAGLAKGYLNKEDLTKERFTANPFRAGERMYRTGDLGRWLPDGKIEYLGRLDDQVKVRGYRIELGEIETVLQQTGLVSQSVVMARADKSGQKQLIGYVVSKEGAAFEREQVLTALRNKLPEYMVPAIWVELEMLPLTPNGKIDRKALPEVDGTALTATAYVAPRNATEEALVEIWQQLLGVQQVGINDNFFELGGHSLLATRLVSAIRKRLNVELAIRSLFAHPTISDLTHHLEDQGEVLLLPPIQKIAERPAQIPLSYSQERLWFIDHLEGTVQYHLPAVLHLRGDINKEALFYALREIVNRHEVLRTVFNEADGKAFQLIKPANEWQLSTTDGQAYKDDPQGLHSYIRQLISKPFDLSKDDMLRAELITLEEEHHVLVATMHHIASDGWSISILIKEVVELYQSFVQGTPGTLRSLPIQYADYSIWQRNYLTGELLDRKIAYWKSKLDGVVPLQLPTDHRRSLIQSTKGAIARFKVGEAVTTQLHTFSKQQNTTLFMTLLAGFKVMLHRYSGQEDICVGSPVANRTQEEVESLIGFFINTLALRSNLPHELSFTNLLQQVKQTTLEAYEHQELPFEKIVEAVVKERDMSRSPLFQVMFVLQNTPDAGAISLGDVALAGENFPAESAKYEMTFSITERSGELFGSVEYNTDLYTADTIHKITGHFTGLLGEILKNPAQAIGSIPMLSPGEKNQLLVDFNDTDVPYPSGKSIIDIFEEQVIKTPEATALLFEDESLSYRQLNEKSNQLTRHLIKTGVTPDTLVPICIERGIDMIVAIFAILKAGAAYVPIDTEYPADRISYMLEDTGALTVITNSTAEAKLPAGLNLVVLDKDAKQVSLLSSENLKNKIAPDQLAYIIYTSGSTGKPKGVMIGHSGVINLACSQSRDLALKSGSVFLQFASFGFDAACYEIFTTLLTGATLALCKKEDLLSAESFERMVSKHQVDVAILPPSFQHEMRDALGPVKTIVSAGEPLNEATGRYIQSKGVRLINAYGPTENTVCATMTDQPILENNTIVIGKPIDNVKAYVLNERRQLVPIGVTGELFLGGAGIAHGYLNRAALTAEKFVSDPFTVDPSAKLYATGDLVRLLPDGNLEYIGRMDDQVKIRGHRIELGEIETVIQQSGFVTQSVVLAREFAGGAKRLVAYLAPAEKYSKDALMAYLRNQLPGYMVPQLWMELEQFPVTTSGKIDRKSLPDIDVNELASNEYLAPRTELEKLLAENWQKLLGIQQVGINDNFFELGGDSILTIQVVSRMRQLGYELQPRDIFNHQTIGKLSVVIAERSGVKVSGEQGILTGKSGLLPIQQWYLEKQFDAISHFNQAVLLGIDKAVTTTVLQQALDQLVLHHDALRFRYTKRNGAWEQAYSKSTTKVIADDLSGYAIDELPSLIKERSAQYQRSLDIEQGKIMQVVLLQTPNEAAHNRILIVIHHLAVDGVSWRILLEDLELLVGAIVNEEEISLGNKTNSYRQWYEALVTYGQRPQLSAQKIYWQNLVDNYKPLPVDIESKSLIQSKDIGHTSTRLDAEQTRKLLQEVPRVYHTEINDILLTALAQTLCNYSGESKVIIGLEGHGREAIAENIDTSRTVGWFTNLYPVLLKAGVRNTDSDWIKSVKEQLRQVPDKGIGYGVLKYINKEESLQKPEPWDVLFNYLGQLDNVVRESKWFAVAMESTGAARSAEHFQEEKLTVTNSIQNGELFINWSYSKLHFEEATIQKLLQQNLASITSLLNHCIAQQQAGAVYTPADYNLGAVVTYDELDRFLDKEYMGQKRRDALEGLYRLGGLQQGMLFHHLYEGGDGTYMNQVCVDLVDANIPELGNSWNHIIQHHSVLRSAFYHDAFPLPVQVVYKNVALPIESLDYSNLSKQEQAEAIKQFEALDRSRGFDFKTAPLMRMTLIRLSDQRHRMIWTSHHILFDGWSLPILMEEFLNTYDVLSANKEVQQDEQDLYEDYIRYIEKGDQLQEEAYWRNYLQGVEHGTLLPFISLNKERTKGVGSYNTITLVVDPLTTNRILNYTQRHHLTVNTVLQGIWALLLSKYTGSKEVTYGVIVSGRPDDLPNVEQRVGMYINTLPLHAVIDREKELIAWLQQVQAEQVASRQFQHTPLQTIQGWTGIPGDFFDSLIVFQNYPVSKLLTAKQWALQVENLKVNDQNNFPLTITVGSGEQITVSLTYNTGLLGSNYAAAIKGHIQQLLLQLINEEDLAIADINPLTKDEQQLLNDFNNTRSKSQADKNVVDLFEEQVLKTPQAIALVFEEEEISFQRLNELSNQVAHHLATKEIRENSLVPICLRPSVDMIVGILGILKAGAAYVPIDPEYPAERICFLLEDTKATVVVTNSESSSKMDGFDNLHLIELDDPLSAFQASPNTNLSKRVLPDHLAYVIYTSGSTGKPKGVMIRHRNLSGYLLNDKTKYISDLTTNAGTFLHLNFTFDASLTGIFMPLLAGKSVVVASKLSLNVFEDSNLEKYAPYDFIKLTPAHLELLESTIQKANNEWLTKKLVIGGEALLFSQLHHLSDANISVDIVNEYGPTEATVGCSTYVFNTLDNSEQFNNGIPIGKPIDNVQLYIVDEHTSLLPPGIMGEICIGGGGVAAGYLNLPEMTQQKFIQNPFGEGYLYRTGDLGRWQPDGNMEYLGRKDDQVKIRGYRVELGEIENTLQQSELVKQAVVLAKPSSDGSKTLIAYVVPLEGFDKDALTHFLHSKLPEYMVPGIWVSLESLPLTSNGKIDRKALAAEETMGQAGKAAYTAPRNDIEEKLTVIWKELLDIDELGVHDDFFDIGGHSLLAIRLISALRKQLEVELAINDIFDYPTVALLAEHLEGREQTLVLPAIGIQSRPALIPLSFSQERLWFIDQLEGSIQYHVPAVLRMRGELNVAALEHAFQQIVDRHQVLRTIFLQENGRAHQVVIDNEAWQLNIIDGTSFKQDELAEIKKQLINTPFVLSKDYMLRAALVKLGVNDHVLVVVIHHIASDGWSTAILVKELVELYGAFEEHRPAVLQPMPLQYLDFAIWQRNYLEGEVLDKKMAYWKSKLADTPPLNLPTDYTRPAVWSARGAIASTRIDKQLMQQLQELSQQKSSTLFMTLLAAFKVLIYRYSGQQDICIGTPIAGRQQQELEGLIGFFVNTLALRSEVNGEAIFTDLLQQVRLVTMEAYEHQEVPFEKIVDEVVTTRDISRNPLFQVMFVMRNTPEIPELRLGNVSFSGESSEHTTAMFDLQVFLTETADGISMVTEYCTDLFAAATINRLMEHFKQLLRAIVVHPQQKVSKLQMLSAAEEQHLLVGLNNTVVDYPVTNVVAIFEEQVLKTPHAVAAVFEEEQFTYEELNRHANQLAHYLLSIGVTAETLVAVCLDRSPQMIVAIWGILKAGAAYVPIDPEYPVERIDYMLEDTGATIIITNPDSTGNIRSDKGILIRELNSVFSLISDQPTTNPGTIIAANGLAYVIYTSGSTGKPKGAMNEHGALANRLMWAQDYFGLTYEDTVLQKTTFCFDVSVWELLWPSLVGAKLVFAKPGGQKDNYYLKALIEKHRVSMLHFVPSMLAVFLPDVLEGDCASLKKVLCSGEALKGAHASLFREKLPQAQLHNLYGPTEAAIDVTCWSMPNDITIDKAIPIGKPVANTAIYMLDESLGLAPLGGIGEIHIGGVQVARGYLNRPELTTEKFIKDPFNKSGNNRLYKTGDLGRWMLDGNVEYLGRKDDQVKIRGFRIELGEIEAVLQQGGLVNEAVVLPKTDKSGNTKLVSYYVPNWSIVQEKESAGCLDRIANWQELYNEEYAKTADENIDQEFNLIGWDSSFTGQPIPVSEMKQWVDHVVAIILERPNESVLEIGCGTGLIYYPLAGKVKKYTGTDLSITSINQIKNRISKAARNYGLTELRVSPAHEVSIAPGETINTIILNSIVQYFPCKEYLDTVMEKSVSLLAGKGRIIIGDVRDNRLQEAFKGRLQANQLPDAVNIAEYKWAVEQEVMKENELCIDPAYFFQLKNIYPQISHVVIKWKQADYLNELSAYRYTVIIYLGETQEAIRPSWRRWDEAKQENSFTELLNEGLGKLALRDVPNPRLWRERMLTKGLQDTLLTTVGDVKKAYRYEDEITSQVNALLHQAKLKGYQYQLLLNEDPFKIDILLELTPTGSLVEQDYKVVDLPPGQFTNIPMFTDISWQLQKDLRLLLQQKLPDYMVPAEMTALRKIPLTSNGKADRKFLSQREERIIINAGNFVAAATELEHLLVTTWQETLGIDQVGVEDNFFDLGGDSILTIQIVSRLRRLGYELQPKDIFIHQTVSRIARAIADRSAATISGEQETLTGESGLLPIQQWYLQNTTTAVDHFNQHVLLTVDKTITETHLQSAIGLLVTQHDALRFQFSKTNNTWKLEYGSNKDFFFIEDLSTAKKEELPYLLSSRADQHQRSLNITTGEIARIVWLITPEDETTNRLLIIIHHLAVDGVSWRIILEDLEAFLNGFKNGQKVTPGHKSNSYRQWFNALEAYGQTRRLLDQNNYWQKVVSSYEPLPFDKGQGEAATAKDTAYQTVRLAAEQTQQLLQEVPRVYHTEINDVLMSVLALTIADWSGNDKVVVGLEGHGREDIVEGMDTSRTVGWFTTLYPVLLTVPQSRSKDELLKAVKEQLRSIPGKGLGFGVLKYINREASLQGSDCWDILFNYLGQLDNVVGKGKWLGVAGESAGAGRNEEQTVSEKLTVIASVRAGQLVLNWGYSSRHFKAETINDLAEKFVINLQTVIAHCLKQQQAGLVFTPSDYGLGAEISYGELDGFLEAPFGEAKRKDRLESMYRLSGLQQGMLFHGLYDEQVMAYTEQFCCDLVGVDVKKLYESWNQVLRRHSVLRSAFYHNAFSIPVQCVYREVELPETILDYRAMPADEQLKAIAAYEAADRLKGFDFSNPPLMRLELLRVAEDRYRMLWTYHHILFDGWSLPIVMEDFLTTYESLVTGQELRQMAEDRFEDHIRYIERKDAGQAQEYWRKYMQGLEQHTLLPFIKPTSERTKGAGEYKAVSLHIDPATTAGIQNYAQRNRLTLNTLMQGVWSYLLHNYSGNENIAYGVIVSGRPDDMPNVEQRVGMFINTVPLHSKLHRHKKVTEWLQDMQEEQVSSRQYQHTPLQEIQRLTGIQGDLFDTLMVFENYPVSKVLGSKRWSLQVENLKVNDQTNYPLSLLIISAQDITVHFNYNNFLLDDREVEMICGHFKNILLQVVSNPDQQLADLDLLTAEEKYQQTEIFNNTYKVFPADQSCIGLFEKQVEQTPAAIALSFEEQHISYSQLNEQANQLAHFLQQKGVAKETLVPICLDRSPEMIVGILAILKAGGAYVPIDLDYPPERIGFMLEDSGASLLVTTSTISKRLPTRAGMELIEIDQQAATLTVMPAVNLPTQVLPGQLAYIIYTSGSTGRPKGVMIENRGVVNLAYHQASDLAINRGTRVLQFASFGFDASCNEIFSTLLAGGNLVLCRKEDLLSAENFERMVNLQNVEIAILPPSFQQEVKDVLGTIKTIISAGEPLNEITAGYLQAKGVRMINAYGPTENTVCATMTDQPILNDGSISIGKPIDNVKAYVLNDHKHLVPLGVTGELCLSGIGVARGYLNRPELTAEKFVVNPFNEDASSRVYLTGDMVRLKAGGNIEYIGRKDDQVKIRGFRIEMGEIENVLLQSGLVSQAVVVARTGLSGNKQLIAYVIPSEEYNKQLVLKYLGERLPAYMVPAIWIEMKRFPIGPSGKIDKKALPVLQADQLLSNEFVAPRNELEEKLVRIWKELLNVERVGITDNFFELGGHSLLAMRMASYIERHLLISIPIRVLFQFSTIIELSKYLEIQADDSTSLKNNTAFQVFDI